LGWSVQAGEAASILEAAITLDYGDCGKSVSVTVETAVILQEA